MTSVYRAIIRPSVLFKGVYSSCIMSQSARPAQRAFSENTLFGNEPDGPQVKTEIPGPESRKAITELDQVFDMRSLNMITNFEKSTGN
jgi:4-aminobutyrate aminotransferase/(S)-3-amino-2-methylpropionate transaminase